MYENLHDQTHQIESLEGKESNSYPVYAHAKIVNLNEELNHVVLSNGHYSKRLIMLRFQQRTQLEQIYWSS